MILVEIYALLQVKLCLSSRPLNYHQGGFPWQEQEIDRFLDQQILVTISTTKNYLEVLPRASLLPWKWAELQASLFAKAWNWKGRFLFFPPLGKLICIKFTPCKLKKDPIRLIHDPEHPPQPRHQHRAPPI